MRKLALLVFVGGVGYAAAHAHCVSKAVDRSQTLSFCPTAVEGVCCTEAEEEVVEERFNVAGTLTAECGDYYKQVVCAICGPFSGHLFDRLLSDLGTLDGLTMTNSFCLEFVDACADQIDFPTYEDGQDYCTKHTGGGGDLYWSYPYMSPKMFEPGFAQVFPDLPHGDKPNNTLAMHQSPSGAFFWLSGRRGVITQVDAITSSSSTTVMDMSGGIFYDGSEEEGLLDFAFSPMFETNGYFYVSYNIWDDVRRNRLSKFEYVSGDPAATRESEDVLLTSESKPEYYHNGGWLGFKPSDYGSSAASHDLYWSIGDAGPQEDPYNHGQRTDTLFGSIVRISVPSDGTGYTVPSGNYPGNSPEICAPGFRNPWRCGFDRDTDDLYCGDVGQTLIESIYKVECGNNYGWGRFEGTHCTDFSEAREGSCSVADRSFMTPPIFEYCQFDYSYSNSDGEYTDGNDPCGDRVVAGNSVIGGYVYRGHAFADLDIYGALIFADYEGRNVYYIKEQGDGTWSPGTIVSDGSVQVVSFSEDVDGELMMIDSSNNIYYLPCGDVCDNAYDDLKPAPSTDDSGDYAELGCYADSFDRVFTGPKVLGQPDMTIEACAEFCEGWTYFGLEWSEKCFCGLATDDPSALGTATCDMPCSGDSSQTCGGSLALSVYVFMG